MQSLVIRALGGLVVTGVSLSVVATPAAAAESSTFRLAASGAVGYGTYDRMMGIPERPVPPIRIAGTLVGRSLFRCAVVQVAGNGPADGIEWRTIGMQCGRGRTDFRIQTSYLFGGAKPPVRLCSGWTKSQAERGRRCDTHRPPADR